jgi:hypothetical protein
MKTKPAYPLFGDPDFYPDNQNNPYEWNSVDSSRGETYFNAPESNSTMVSDSVEMTKRLKAFVPMSSVKKGRFPQNYLGYGQNTEEWNEGDNYEAKYQ